MGNRPPRKSAAKSGNTEYWEYLRKRATQPVVIHDADGAGLEAALSACYTGRMTLDELLCEYKSLESAWHAAFEEFSRTQNAAAVRKGVELRRELLAIRNEIIELPWPGARTRPEASTGS